MKKMFWTLACGAVALALTAAPAFALPDFKKIFDEEVVKKNEKLVEPMKSEAGGCNACHVPKEKKTVNNAFGQQLDALIEGEAAGRIKDASTAEKPAVKEKINEEFKEALKKVLEMKPEGGDKTYKQMFEEGTLPGGGAAK
ncbi:MAG TPA: hypothetical protein VGN57_14835 [Pirellulaceae bacterium]|jgi:mono/diheme cytochrome c family protein|nr:hypothetical protein [Pirellulaceae bacterium]